jgi:hypothetical protein
LIYWVTSNAWTLAQSHYIYKKYPMATPGQATGETAKPGARTGAPKAGTAKAGAAKAGGAKAGAARTTAKAAARAGAGKAAGDGVGDRSKKAGTEEEVADAPPKVARQQPTRQPRSKRKR